MPVVALAAVNQHSPLAMVTLAKTKVLKSPADLKGLNIGIHPAGSTYIFFKALLAANGLTEADMKISSVAPPYESYLLLGRVNSVVGYIDAEVPELEAKAGGAGALSILLGAGYGWKVYGSGLFTSEAMIKAKPDLVKRFVKAYGEAFDYVIAHPEEAAAITANGDRLRGQGGHPAGAAQGGHRLNLHQRRHQGPRPRLDDQGAMAADAAGDDRPGRPEVRSAGRRVSPTLS